MALNYKIIISRDNILRELLDQWNFTVPLINLQSKYTSLHMVLANECLSSSIIDYLSEHNE
jgi:hypothetical protein